jgi:hypothetical protein
MSNGRVGIGCNNPSFNLHVNGIGFIQSATLGSLTCTGNSAWLSGPGYTPTVSIGYTTVQASGFALDVSGEIHSIFGNRSVTIGYSGIPQIPSIVFSSNAILAAIGFNATTNIMIYGYGNNPSHTFLGVVTATDFVATSDKTLKENIVDARTNYLDDLNKLRVVNYNRIGKTKKELGFIAQEMEEVFPSVVEINKYDNTKAYAITALIPMLVSAVQSLSKTVSSLQGQIDEIKSASNPITP